MACFRVFLALVGLLLLPGLAPAQSAPFSSQETLVSLLQKGELTLIETKADSSLKQVTAIALVKAPISEVWERLVNYPAYLKWMPKVAEATVLSRQGSQVDVQWEVEVPGPNYRYVVRNQEDREHYVLHQKQHAGALGGSFWTWQLVALDADRTLVYRSSFTNVTDESWIAKQLEDDSHTLSYGINTSSALLEVKAVRRAAEKRR
jgi:ribosome-associated toxin RatA of RatAB toxin-antitoxin module